MKVSIPDCGKGLNKDLLPAELELGVWSDALNFRFRNGFAEKFEGIYATQNAFGSTLEWLVPYQSVTRRAVAATKDRCYSDDGLGGRYELTRFLNGVEIASITRVGTTATLTTVSAHGRSTFDTCSMYGNFPAEYNVDSTGITVTGANTFTYVMAGTPSGSATTLGAYTKDTITIFTAGAAGDRQTWTGGVLNGILIANKPSDGLYYWGGNILLPLRKFPFSYLSDVARIFKNYIVQLAPTISGVKYPHDVLWSESAEPGAIPASFTSSSTNDSGRQALAETPGVMVDALAMGDALIIYKQDARHSMQYIGGNDVFRFNRLPGNDGLLTSNCVVSTPVGHVFLTPELDVKIHTGGEATSIADGIVKKTLNATLDPDNASHTFLAVNPAKNEVWVAVSSGANANPYPDRFFIWNWVSKTWSFFNFGGQLLGCAAHGVWPTSMTTGTTGLRMFVGNYDASGQYKMGIVDELAAGAVYGSALTGTLERTGLHFEDRDTFKSIQRSRWNVDGDASETATVYHGSSKTADGTVTYSSGTTLTTGTTDYVNARATQGRFGAIKLTTTAYPYSVRSVDLDVTGGAKR